MNNFSFNVIEVGKGDITNFLDALNRGLRDLGTGSGGGGGGSSGGNGSSASALLTSQGFALSQSDAVEPSTVAADSSAGTGTGIAIPAHDQVIGAEEGVGGEEDDDDDDDDDDGMDFLAGDAKALLEQAANEALKAGPSAVIAGAGEGTAEDGDTIVAQGQGPAVA